MTQGFSPRNWLLRAPRAQAVDLRGKRAIVTGAALGSIGFETALTLARWGAAVTVTTRSQPQRLLDALNARLGSAPHGRIDALTLDLSQAASVAHFTEAYTQDHGASLDVLVNNAGIHLDLLSQWQAPQLTADGFEIHWRTNFLGTMQLTQRLLPSLQAAARANGGARIVNVVSELHRRGHNAGLFVPPSPYNSWVAYGLSKLALVHASFELQRRHAQADGVQAYCLHPGAVFTNIASKGLSGNPLIESLRNAMAPVEAFFLLTPEQGAQTSLACATQADLIGGRYYRRCRVATASADADDAQVSARLWTQTQRWLATLREQA